MRRTFRFRALDPAPSLVPEAVAATTDVRMDMLVADIRRNIAALEADIAADQARCGIHDPTDVNYSWVAQNWADRCRNLKITLADLEARLAAKDTASAPR